MAGASAWIETLEKRGLLSVSGAVLAGPLTIGSTWKYDDGSTVSINGPGENTHLKTSYLAISTGYPRTDYPAIPYGTTYDEAVVRQLGLVALGSDYTYDYSFDQTDLINNPPQVVIPPVMVGGQVYSSNYNQTMYGKYGYAGVIQHKSTVELMSETLQPITVPAGTFSCYEIVSTDSLSGSQTRFVAPGVGVVETISTEGASTVRLTSYNLSSPSTTGQLVPDVISSNLPANVIAGSRLHAFARVQIDNLGWTSYSGKLTTQLFLSTGSGIDSSSILVGSLQRRVSMRPRGAKVFNVPIGTIPANLNDQYYLIARTIDSAGLQVDAGSAVSAKVGPGFADLNVNLVDAVAPRGSSGPAIVTVTINRAITESRG